MSVPIETIIFGELIKKDTPQDLENQILAQRGFYWLEKKGLKVLICRHMQEKGFLNGFSTRIGGVSPFPKDSLNLAGFDEDSPENILENRRRFLDALNPEFSIATTWQVHGDNIIVFNSPEKALDSKSKADAIISDLVKTFVGVKTADCVPVLIADPIKRSFAAIHAGWRGTYQKIVSKTVKKMQYEYNSLPENLICALGPAAVSEYEVGSEVIQLFYEKFPEKAESFFRPSQNKDRALLNLHLANVSQLLEANVRIENIFVAPFCTMQRVDLFFSYRVEKRLHGKVGRLLSVIGKLK